MKIIMNKIKNINERPIRNITVFLFIGMITVYSVIYNSESVPDFIEYMLIAISTISMGIAITSFINLYTRSNSIKKIEAKIKNIPVINDLITDEFFRKIFFTYSSIIKDASYVIIKTYIGILLKQNWLIIIAGYYTVLVITKTVIVVTVKKINKIIDSNKHEYMEWHTYTLVGIIQIVMSLLFLYITLLVVFSNMNYHYYGILIYLAAIIDFYLIITAAINLVNTNKKPLIECINIIGFNTALISLFSLQSAMIITFGEIGDISGRKLMNGITGGIIFLILFLIGSFMIYRGSMKIKKFNKMETF